MKTLEIRPLRTRRERRIFLTFPWQIYRRDPLWVPPLLPERARVIDPQRGPFFQRGQAEFFIAWRGGKPVGTICAGEDRKTNQDAGRQDCLFGFFEVIEDYAVAEALLNQVADWGKQRGLATLYGPFNLDYEDSYGVLIEGRDRPPALLCGHTPPYYQDFLERYGLQPARGDNLAYAISVEETEAVQRLYRLAERVRQRRPDVCIRNADLAHWEEEIERVYGLINIALAHLPDFTGWQRDALYSTLEPFRQIVDPELVLFAEVDGRVVGWFPGIPNLNEAFKHAGGLRYPWNYLQLGWYMRRQAESLSIKSVLVHPDYWDTGVSILMFAEMAKRAIARGYRWVDLSLTSDDNPDTPILAKHMGAKLYKRYRVYRTEIP